MSTNPREPARRPRPLAVVPKKAQEISQRMAVPRSQPVAPQTSSRAIAVEANLKKLRGYRSEDLMAIAEIGYHYLFSGGYNLALPLFEGLQAIDPTEGYFAAALGLVHDHLGNLEEAELWYRKAAALDPGDPRPEINRAELRILKADFAKARELLIRGTNKAKARGDSALEGKARALLSHLSIAH